ncbi:hypothetical protein Tco_1419394 [Tanacetum coccineum]
MISSPIRGRLLRLRDCVHVRCSEPCQAPQKLKFLGGSGSALDGLHCVLVDSLTGEWLTFQKTLVSEACSALITNFRHSLGAFGFSYPTEPIDEVLRDRLVRHPFEARTFPEPILYLTGLTSSWEHAPNAPSIFVDEEDMSFRNFMKRPGQAATFSVRPADQPVDMGSPSVDHSKAVNDSDQGESSSISKNQDVAGLELAVVEDDPYDQGAGVGEGSGKKRSITAALEEGASKVKSVATGSSSRHEAKKRKQYGPRRTSSRGSVPLLPAFAPKDSLLKARKNQDVEGSKVVRDLIAEVKRLFKELSAFHDVSKSSEDSRKVLDEEVERLRPVVSEVVDLKRTELVKYFLPLAVKKMMASDHFNQAMGDLQKAMIFGRAEKMFDEAAEAFDKLEFPYISLLARMREKALESLLLLSLLPAKRLPPPPQ